MENSIAKLDADVSCGTPSVKSPIVAWKTS